MSHLLIGLHGLARTGKDTVARCLAAHYALLSYAFAEPLKHALAHMFSLTEAQVEGAIKEQNIEWLGKSPRQLMQLLGTEWGRHLVHPDLWLLLAQQNISNHLSIDQTRYNGVVVRDVRFENEATWLRKQGGSVVHILRPDAPSVASHSSESGLIIHDNDFVLRNEGSLDDLYAQVAQLMLIVRARQRLRNAA
jgi:hypothetical protein